MTGFKTGHQFEFCIGGTVLYLPYRTVTAIKSDSFISYSNRTVIGV